MQIGIAMGKKARFLYNMYAFVYFLVVLKVLRHINRELTSDLVTGEVHIAVGNHSIIGTVVVNVFQRSAAIEGSSGERWSNTNSFLSSLYTKLIFAIYEYSNTILLNVLFPFLKTYGILNDDLSLAG